MALILLLKREELDSCPWRGRLGWDSMMQNTTSASLNPIPSFLMKCSCLIPLFLVVKSETINKDRLNLLPPPLNISCSCLMSLCQCFWTLKALTGLPSRYSSSLIMRNPSSSSTFQNVMLQVLSELWSLAPRSCSRSHLKRQGDFPKFFRSYAL